MGEGSDLQQIYRTEKNQEDLIASQPKTKKTKTNQNDKKYSDKKKVLFLDIETVPGVSNLQNFLKPKKNFGIKTTRQREEDFLLRRFYGDKSQNNGRIWKNYCISIWDLR